jgi:hypothetical protein
MAVVNMCVSWGQEVTSVLQKRAFGLPFEPSYCVRRARASGRRVRSARRTEQPRERRRAVKEKFMPGKCELGSMFEGWDRYRNQHLLRWHSCL